MSELASALFSIADANEFRFARFYIVCEEVPLGTPESPPIVSGVSDMHPSDCPNVEETRNPMQTFSRKKCSHFSPTNSQLHFHMKSSSVFLIILLINPKEVYAYCGNSFLSPLLFQQPQKDFSPLHFFRFLISVRPGVQQRIF